MTSRLYLLAAIWLFGWAMPEIAARQPEQSEGPVEPEQTTPAPEPPPVPEKTVEQAVNAAMNALDRLESAEFGEPMETVFAEVTEHLEFVRKSNPTDPMLPYLYGRTYVLAGRPAEAVEHLQKFVETREGRHEWRAFRLLGDLFVEQYPQLAKANYKSAAALKADQPDVLFGLARCAAKLGQKAEAIRRARDAVTADRRRTIRYLSFLARMLLADRQWDEAEREAEAARDLARESMRRYPGMRRPVEALDAQYGLLIDILRSRVAEGDGKVDDYLRLAKYVQDRAEVTAMLSSYDVLAILEAAVDKTAPDTPPRLLEQHGIVLAQIDRREEAIAVFERLLQKDPDNPVAATWLERLRDKSGGSELSDEP